MLISCKANAKKKFSFESGINGGEGYELFIKSYEMLYNKYKRLHEVGYGLNVLSLKKLDCKVDGGTEK